MVVDSHEQRQANKRALQEDDNAETVASCYRPTSGTFDPSSLHFYDVLYSYLKSAEFADSVRVGTAEVVPPISAEVDGLSIQTSKDLALLYITSIFAFSLPDLDASGNKNLLELGEFSYADSAGLLMGIHHFNNGIGRVVKEVEGINETCNIRLTTRIYDSEGSQTTSVDKLMDEILETKNRLPAALFAATRSVVSVPLAILSGIYDIPQISAFSTTRELDKHDQFKHFSRLIPSDAGTSVAAVEYLRSRLNVTHCGVLFVNNAYGGAYNQAFKETAVDRPEDDRIAVKSFGFTDGNDAELKLAVRQMKNSGNRVFFAMIYRTHFDTVMTEAVRLGIAGPEYIWIVGDSVDENFLNGRKFPKGSPLAIATQGVGIIKAQGGISTDSGDTGFDRFLDAWYDQDDKAVSYYNCKQPKNNTSNGIDEYYKADLGFFKPNQKLPPTTGAVFSYDSAIALGLAACRLALSGGEDYFDGKELTNEFIRSSFEGASGNITIDPKTGTRNIPSSLFVMFNVNGVDDGDDVEFRVSLVSHTVKNPDESLHPFSWQNASGKQFIYSDGTTRHPPVLPPIVGENRNQLNNVRYGGLALSAIILFCSVVFAVWACCLRNNRVVKTAQPMFLYVICFGAFVMGSAIITFSIDDEIASVEACNVACMASPWLISLGFCVAISALYAKILRIHRIFGHVQDRQSKITTKDIILPLTILLLLNTIVLLAWTLISPLRWERFIRGGTDQFGRPLESYGLCSINDNKDITYIVLLVVINLGVLIFANVQAYQSRSIADEFNESKYVGISVASILQACVVGLPVVFLVREQPPASFFVRSGILFAICMSVLLLIFIPKIVNTRKLQRERNKG